MTESMTHEELVSEIQRLKLRVRTLELRSADPDAPMNCKEAAAFTGYAIGYIRQVVCMRLIPYINPGSPRFRKKQLEKWLELGGAREAKKRHLEMIQKGWSSKWSDDEIDTYVWFAERPGSVSQRGKAA